MPLTTLFQESARTGWRSRRPNMSRGCMRVPKRPGRYARWCWAEDMAAPVKGWLATSRELRRYPGRRHPRVPAAVAALSVLAGGGRPRQG